MKMSNRTALVLFALLVFALQSGLSQELTQAHRDSFAKCKELQGEGKWTEAREIATGLASEFASAPASRTKLVFTNELAPPILAASALIAPARRATSAAVSAF